MDGLVRQGKVFPDLNGNLSYQTLYLTGQKQWNTSPTMTYA